MKEIINKALKEKGLTQKEFAEIIRVTPQAVSKWVNGESEPTKENIEYMREVFGDDVANQLLKKIEKNYKVTKKPVSIQKLNTIDKAKVEAKRILDSSGISNYSRATYQLLDLLIISVIGLVYHQYINKKSDGEACYDDIYYFLNDYLEDDGTDLKKEFYLFGMDLFESFGEYKLPNDEYGREIERIWYKYVNAMEKGFDSKLRSEFYVALTNVITLNSDY